MSGWDIVIVIIGMGAGLMRRCGDADFIMGWDGTQALSLGFLSCCSQDG